MMQTTICKRLRWCLALLAAFATLLIGIHASADGLAFSVQPVLPTQQVNSKVTYFDVKMAPKARTTLVINVHNNKSTPLHLTTRLAQATTNLNGVVEYGANKERLDSNVPAKFSQVVKLPSQAITVAPNADDHVQIQVNMPKRGFNGQLAGGLTLSDADAAKQAGAQKKQSIAINNQYQFVVAIVLRNNLKSVTPKLTLGAVTPSQINARNVVSGELHNQTATFINQMKVTGTVKRAGAILYTTKQTGYQMAPNAIMKFPVWLKGRPLAAGHYTLTLAASAKQRHWQFTRKFTITAAKAKHLDGSSVEVKPDNTWRNVAIGTGGGVIVLAGLLGWTIVRRRH